ncbi:MAG: hypothetical protein DWQ42_14935 [Planctomycetota bacterium]|nr:MAG: hypothetical protein DWQ42_14935 [Planctomycetota bacterium]REK47639.1 MAG: hypothetical protein DWQ46_04215 [Planctomycetota bacterium]
MAMAVLLLAGLTFVLLYPLPQLSRGWTSLLDLAHAPAFALVTVFLVRGVEHVLGSHSWRWALLVGFCMLAVGMGTELLQAATGRSVTLHDAVANTLGVLAGVAWCVATSIATRSANLLLRGAAGLLLLFASLPPLGIMLDIARAHYEMPLLSSFENQLELTRWVERNCRMARTEEGVTDGRWALEVDLSTAKYSGVTMHSPRCDWVAYEDFVFDLTLPEGAEPLELIVKIEDFWHTGEWHDRFHEAIQLTPGTHEIRIPLARIEQAPRGRQMKLQGIARIQWFAIELPRERRIYLDNVRLE